MVNFQGNTFSNEHSTYRAHLAGLAYLSLAYCVIDSSKGIKVCCMLPFFFSCVGWKCGNQKPKTPLSKGLDGWLLGARARNMGNDYWLIGPMVTCVCGMRLCFRVFTACAHQRRPHKVYGNELGAL